MRDHASSLLFSGEEATKLLEIGKEIVREVVLGG